MQQGARELNNLIEQISKKVVDKAIDEKYLMSRMAVIVNEFDAATNSASVIIPTDLEHPTDYKYPNRTGKIRLHNTVWNGKDIATYGDKVYLVYQTNNISQGWLEGNNALNIDASKYVLKSGDTMTGNLNLNVSNGAVKVTDPTYGVATSLLVGSGHINHGIYSYNYYNGTSLVSNGVWMLYRNTNGDVIMDGNARKDSDGNVITSTYIKQGTEVQTTGTDLNDYTTTGIYHFTSSYTPTNIPAGNNGWLMVMKVPNTSAVKQIWFRQGTNGTNDWHTFVRQYSGSAWSAWKRYIVDGDTLSNDLNFAANKGINFVTSGRIYWKEDGYGDQFAIVPAFSGSDDANLLKIQSAVGAAGTTPTMTDKVTVSGKTGDVNLLTGSLTSPSGSIWAGTDGSTAAERNVGVRSGAGTIYMYSQATASGGRGIYVPAHGTGSAKAVVAVDTNNNATFNGNASTATTASKLGSSTVGASGNPIYLNGGTATACSAPASGQWFQGVPQVGSDGVMEIGRYIDFHPTNASTLDYSKRIDAGTGTTARTLTLPDASGTFLVNNAGNFVSLFSGTLNSSTTSTTFTGANYSAYCIIGVDAENPVIYETMIVPRAFITTTEKHFRFVFSNSSGSSYNSHFSLTASAATGGTITLKWIANCAIVAAYGIR